MSHCRFELIEIRVAASGSARPRPVNRNAQGRLNRTLEMKFVVVTYNFHRLFFA
jgi:hypothetical protein